jgi:two-component system sensor histidine kinase ChvG
LSWRIRRLSRAASNAISKDGRVTENFPRSTAGDEIGELSRHYAKLLDRVREYNDYLRTLSRKLSHELRTPIAVIQTSLDNLEQAREKTDDSDVYVQRAREGLSRLQHILTAMSEANRLEESIRNNQTQELDLVPLISDVFEAYRGIYTGHSLSLDMQCDCAPVQGAPDLIVQALDKLVENAASFCPAGGEITLRLAGDGPRWAIQLSNDGPALPAAIQDHLFDPMVSLREEQAGNVHLGLGLHIVRLISDFHQGQVRAENRPEHNGVVVTLLIPKLENGVS